MPTIQNGRVACRSASAYTVLEVSDGEYVVEHSCEIHYWKLTLPVEVVLGARPKAGEEVVINLRLTLAAKEKRRRARQQLATAGRV